MQAKAHVYTRAAAGISPVLFTVRLSLPLYNLFLFVFVSFFFSLQACVSHIYSRQYKRVSEPTSGIGCITLKSEYTRMKVVVIAIFSAA